MKFVLRNVWKDERLTTYIDKLFEAGYAITKYDKEFFISVKDFEDLKRVCTIIEEFNVVISFSTKGDEPTLEIYDDWRERYFMTLSNWIVEKYFIKCKSCGYEIIIGERHTAPRKCPNCNATMMETMEGEKTND